MSNSSLQRQDREELNRLLGFHPDELGEPAGAPLAADDLLEAARRLASAREVPPDTAATDALATSLLQRLGHDAGQDLSSEPLPQAVPHTSLLDGVLAVLAPQVRLLQAPFWLATAIVLLGGLVMAAWLGHGATSASAFLLAIVPLLTALGVSFAYFTGDRLLELEATWPITPEQVVWGRTLLVVGYDIVLAVGASAVLTIAQPGVHWFALMSTWLAPLFGLAAVSLLATVHLGPWQGTAISSTLWAACLFAHVRGWTNWFEIGELHSPFWVRGLLATVLGAALWISLRHTASVTRDRWLRLGFMA